jgi:ABC-type multidrug transport system fused ATPase/permease subunit
MSADANQPGPLDRSDRYREFARLGRGGRDDRLSLGVILRLFARCVPLLRPIAWPLVGMIGCMTMLALLVAVPGINIVNIFWNGILTGQPISELQASMIRLDPSLYARTGETLTPDERKTLLRALVDMVGIVSLILAPLFIAVAYWRIWILQQINQHLRLMMMDRLQSLSLRFHAEQRVGDSMYRMFQDSSMVTQLIHLLVLHPIENVARFAFSLALVALWDPRLALLLLLAWPPLLFVGHRVARPMRVGFRRAREANSALTSRIQETLAGMKIIKAYGAEAYEQARFEQASLSAFETAYAARNRFVTYKVAIFWMVGVFLMLGVAAATGLTAQGASLFGERFMVAMGFAAINAGIWDLGFYNNFKDRFGDGARSVNTMMDIWGSIQDVATGLDRTFELLDLEPEIENAVDARPFEGLKRGIGYRGVSFQYERDRKILQDVDFDVNSGQVVAIVGPTGSGKTTLMSLLLRLYDPDEGAIEIDGHDIREFTVESLRDNISIALQENILFGTTVRENIRYAVPDASDEAVHEAARVACADDFIAELPDGYDTLLGERGTKLSTGQRQRISIARAILKDTPILILDEPTASLDAATEQSVLRNLASWGQGRAIFLITHRLSTIRRADVVAVLRDGQLLEHGPHAELMSRDGGEYRRLVEAEEEPLAALALGGGAS